MNDQPLISILLCTHNGAAFLQEQLDSIALQTYQNIEVVCSDNDSKDGSYQILENWCAENPLRKLTKQEIPGLNKNFYNALQFATGEYIMFCDQDDVWLPHKVQRLVEYRSANKTASMCFGLSQQFTGNTPLQVTAMKPAPRLHGQDLRKTLLISFTLGHNMIISKEVLLQIPIPKDEVIAYDWWITVGAMCLGPISCCEEVLTFWRQHPSNTTKIFNQSFFYKSRLQYLDAFQKHTLIPKETKEWITEAKSYFEKLHASKFSWPLFFFLMNYANQVFFYKTKKGPLKWISYSKLAYKMSKPDFKP